MSFLCQSYYTVLVVKIDKEEKANVVFFSSALWCKGNTEELSGPRRSVCNCTSAAVTGQHYRWSTKCKKETQRKDDIGLFSLSIITL